MKRIFAFLIDYFLVALISFSLIFFTYIFFSSQFYPEYWLYPSVKMFSLYSPWLGALSAFLLPIFRDVIFGGASLGKRIMGLRIVKMGTNEKPSVGILLLRNLTITFVTVEFIVWLILKGRRLGDIIGKTEVVNKH